MLAKPLAAEQGKRAQQAFSRLCLCARASGVAGQGWTEPSAALIRLPCACLCVQVMKWSDGTYLEDQDMWWLSGIHRWVGQGAKCAGRQLVVDGGRVRAGKLGRLSSECGAKNSTTAGSEHVLPSAQFSYARWLHVGRQLCATRVGSTHPDSHPSASASLCASLLRLCARKQGCLLPVQAPDPHCRLFCPHPAGLWRRRRAHLRQVKMRGLNAAGPARRRRQSRE